MAIPGYPVESILVTDTFKQWADKCNAIVDAIEYTNFLTTEALGDFLTADMNAIITGSWTFTNGTAFTNAVNFNNPNWDVTITGGGNGSFSVGKASIFSQNFTLSRTAVDPYLIFKRGALEANIKFDTALDNFTFSKDLTVTGLTVPNLNNTTEQITIGTVDYIWPNTLASSPTWTASDRLMAVDTSTGSPYTIKYFDDQFIIDEAVAQALAAAASENLVLPYEQIPVGTHIHVTEEVLTTWPQAINPGEYDINAIYPGWRVLDGSTLSYDDNALPDPDNTYKKLIQLLDPTQTGATGTATLPNRLDQPYELTLKSEVSGFQIIEDATLAEGIPSGNYNVNLDIVVGSGRNYGIVLLAYGEITDFGTSGGAAKTLNVTGGQFTAVKSAQYGGANTVTCTFTTPLSNDNYNVLFEIISLGDINFDNDTTHPVVISSTKSNTGFEFSVDNNYGTDNIQINVRVESTELYGEGGTGSVGTGSIATLNRNFIVPSNQYLHFSADDVTAGSYDIQYAITSSTTPPADGAVDWLVWDSITGPTPLEYHGVVTNLKAGSTLIKASADNASNFRVYAGDGIDITPTGPNPIAGSFDIYGTTVDGLGVKLATGNNFLDFDSGGLRVAPYGGSKPDGFSVHAVVGTLARRRNDTGGLRVGDPVDDDDAATKSYVDSFTSNSATVYALQEPIRSISTPEYENAYQEMATPIRNDPGDCALIDHKRFVRYYCEKTGQGSNGTNAAWKFANDRDTAARYIGFRGDYDPIGPTKHPLNSRYGIYAGNAKKIYNFSNVAVVIDEDDKAYLTGNNNIGYLGDGYFRSDHTGEFEYVSESDYLPIASNNSVVAIGENDPLHKLIPAFIRDAEDIEDGIGFAVDWISFGTLHQDGGPDIYVKHKDIDPKFDNLTNHHGKIYQYTTGTNGLATNGTSTATTFQDGGRQLGPSLTQPWRNVWHAYAIDKTNINTIEQSFHYDKSNANQWYVKYIYISARNAYMLVARNGDTTGAETELWAVGQNNTDGACSRGDLDDSSATGASWPVPVITNITTQITNTTQPSSFPASGVYDTTGWSVTLRDWDIVTNGTTQYIVRLGDNTVDGFGLGQNPTTRARFFNNDNDAANNINRRTVNLTSLFLHERLTGVDQFTSFWSDNGGYGLYLAKTYDGKIYGWGQNNQGGGLGLTNQSKITTATQSVFPAPGGETPIAILSGGRDAGKGGTRAGQAGRAANFYISEMPDGQRKLYGSGDATTGRMGQYTLATLDNGANSGDARVLSWKQLSSNNESVEKAFACSYGRALWYVGVPTNGVDPPVLKVAGAAEKENSYFLGLGSHDLGDASIITKNYIPVKFPENPLNIVQITTSNNGTLIFCKDDPSDELGRVYFAGNTITMGFESSAHGIFELIDRHLLNTFS